MRDNQLLRKRFSFLLIGTAFGTVVGYLLFNFQRYLSKVLSQPRLLSRVVLTPFDHSVSVESRAMSIAGENLLAGIEQRRLIDGSQKLVLNAGPRNFREPWARDFGFASYGLLVMHEYQAIRENLEVFFMNQLPDGQLPIKIHSTSIPVRYLHSLLGREQPIYDPIKPKYLSGHKTLSLDGNALLVIAAINYILTCKDLEFAETNWPAIVRGLRWLEIHAQGEDGLLYQGPYSDWADSIARHGRVLYTNVLYWKALKDVAEAAGEYGKIEDESYFNFRAGQIRSAINDHFWRDDLGYYVTNQVFENLSASGNLLAIAWDLATSEQSHSILDAMQTFGMANPVPTRPVHVPYPRRYIALENRLGGIGYYHTDAAWIWLGAWHVIAAQHVGRSAEARELLERIARVIVRDGEVHEVYAPHGRYISTLWYTSEAPLTWSAGMFVYACSQMDIQPA